MPEGEREREEQGGWQFENCEWFYITEEFNGGVTLIRGIERQTRNYYGGIRISKIHPTHASPPREFFWNSTRSSSDRIPTSGWPMFPDMTACDLFPSCSRQESPLDISRLLEKPKSHSCSRFEF